MVTQQRPFAWLTLSLLALPLVWSLWHAVMAGIGTPGWAGLVTDPQTLLALRMSLWTGLASAGCATVVCAWMLSVTTTPTLLQRLLQKQALLLAVPHAAFAVGLVLLLAPPGWLLRLLSPWATGMVSPPPWPTTQDPWGLGLIAVLTLKEIPFLLWAAGAHLLRPDVARRLSAELQLAATLGYPARAAWWRIVWPQLLPRMAAPMLAVLAYSLTVVDVAWVIGPATPPTLAVLAWQWLQDASALENAKGVAAAWLLAFTVAACAGGAWLLLNARVWRTWRTRGAKRPGTVATLWVPQSALQVPTIHGKAMSGVYLIYGAVLLALLLGSVTGPWPFPDLLPAQWSLTAWRTVAASGGTLWTTLWLAFLSACGALLWAVAWLELAPAHWQIRLQALVYVPLALPPLLWVVGMHRLAMAWSLDGTATGLWLTHWLACTPYVLLIAQGAYTGFDVRLFNVAATLGHSRWHFVWRIKWPMLRASLASAFAVGFAVSVAQYLPTLYVGAGRFATVTTEAVTLAAGGQRNLMAAFAWLQWLLPAAVFGLAALAGRIRRLPHTPAALGTISA